MLALPITETSHDEDQSDVPCRTQVTTFRVECVGVGVMRQANHLAQILRAQPFPSVLSLSRN